MSKKITNSQEFSATNLYRLEWTDKTKSFDSIKKEDIFICLNCGVGEKSLSNFYKINDINIENSNLFRQFSIYEFEDEKYKQELLSKNYANTQNLLNIITL